MNKFDSLNNIYFILEHDIDGELFLPIVKHASTIRCMTGYFTSGAIKELAKSIFYFLNNEENKIQFLVSPNLETKDLMEIKKAIDADKNIIPLLFPNFQLTENALKAKTVQALSYLIASGKLELRIVLQKEGLFHPKCWLFGVDEGTIAVYGSSNVTQSGVTINFEHLTVNKSWDSIS